MARRGPGRAPRSSGRTTDPDDDEPVRRGRRRNQIIAVILLLGLSLPLIFGAFVSAVGR